MVTSPTSPTEYTADPPTILEREIHTAVHSCTQYSCTNWYIRYFRHTRTVPTYLFCVVGSNDGAHRVYIRP